MSTFPKVPSRGADLNKEIQNIIGKMVEGKITPEETVRYREMVEERGKAMRPAMPPRNSYVHFHKMRAG